MDSSQDLCVPGKGERLLAMAAQFVFTDLSGPHPPHSYPHAPHYSQLAGALTNQTPASSILSS